MTTYHDPACGRTCPMVDPEVSSKFFKDFGAMQTDVRAIKDSVGTLASGVGELRTERDQ